MTITLNGKTVTLDGVSTVRELLEHYQLQHKILVVERNGVIINSESYSETPIMDGDRVEIVHFVGGG